MARALRINLAGGRYHVTARGNERKAIFRDDTDRFHFLELVGEQGERFGTRVHAYVLMDNHFHLLLETPEANLSRAIEVVPQQRRRRAVELPLLGRVAAGEPIEALEQADAIAVPEEFIRRQNTYVLRVVGNSMINDGIWDGDYIVVEERPAPNNGETVVATVNGEATVKRFYREKGGMIRLQPANDSLKPIIVKAKDLTIRGVVVAVMRKY